MEEILDLMRFTHLVSGKKCILVIRKSHHKHIQGYKVLKEHSDEIFAEIGMPITYVKQGSWKGKPTWSVKFSTRYDDQHKIFRFKDCEFLSKDEAQKLIFLTEL